MKFSQSIVAILLVLFVFGCSQGPITIKKYQKDGIQFQHYSNWKVTEDGPIDESPNVRFLSLDGPNEAFITLKCLPPESDETIESYAEAVADLFAKRIREKISVGPLTLLNSGNLSSSIVEGMIAGKKQDGILQLFTVSLLGVEVPTQRKFFNINNKKYKVLIMTQVSAEDSEAVEPGFRLSLNSLDIQ